MDEGRHFGSISKLYDKARVSYPPALIQDILNFSGLKTEKVLDIGCGTGQATILLGEKGFNVTGLDLDCDMVKVAKAKCSFLFNVDFKTGAFEEIEFADRYFNLVLSGMAWHWISSEKHYEKVHRILKNNGVIALFWSYQQKEKSDFVRDVSQIVDKYGGINRGPTGSKVLEIAHDSIDELKKSNLFTSVEFHEYNEEIQFTKKQYLDLLISYGWVQKLSESKRKEFVDEIKKIYKKYEETLVVPYSYVLVLGRRV